MPELPEVETVKNQIAKRIGTARIESIEIRNPNLRCKVPADFAKMILGACISSYRRIGKYFVIDMNNGLSIIWHLGMSGKITVLETMPESFGKHDHVIIKTSKGILIYNDVRRFGMLVYCCTAELLRHRVFAKMGIDPFDKNLTPAYLANSLKNIKTPIKVALLDQSIINGIGNIYASEILFAAKISPLRAANTMSLLECESIINNTQSILQKSIDSGGSTLKDYIKPNGEKGNFQNLHCVYDKTGQRCPNCSCDIAKSGGIKKIVQSGRSTFYCPIIQKSEQ